VPGHVEGFHGVAWNRAHVGGVNQDVHHDAEDDEAAMTTVDPVISVDGFDAFYRAEYARTVRLARLLTGSAGVAEDLAQEAFLRVYRQAVAPDNSAGFLRTVTVNLCHNWHRGRSREALRMARIAQSPQSLSLEANELDAVVGALPYRQRAVLVLRYWLDLSEADIAKALGCRAGTVKSLHARALARLRQEIPR
jgi:RNA polymerase sigma factor (sigma-70 family)